MLLPKDAKFIGQGITGSEGQSALPWMLKYGTDIVAGVTPDKGGRELLGIRIFDTVQEVIHKYGHIDGSVQFVPPLFTKTAVFEAIDSGIKFILIGAEKVPVKDSSLIYAYAKKHGVTVIGPSSVGLICPSRKIKIGSIGGMNPERVFANGNIGLISKSGGMTSEIGLLLKKAGLGVSWAVGIGGERVVSTTFSDFLLDLEDDRNTKATVIFGELGGTYEESVAELVKQGKIKKPIVAFIAGEFTMKLPSDVQFGHAGAIIEGKKGMPSEKRKILRKAGVNVAEELDDITSLLKKLI